MKLALITCAMGFFIGAKGFAICVSKKSTPLYREPQTTAVVVAKAERFTPLRWTGKKQSGFFEVVNFDGQKSWVPVSMISVRMSCLTVKVKKSLLRTGPGAEFPLATYSARKLESFLDHGGEDGWTLVENHEGKKAWINLDHTWKPQQILRMSFDNR